MSEYIDLLARSSDLKDTSKDLLARKEDLNQKFTPISIVKKRPTWMTPDFNPQIADKNTTFTPFSVVTSPYYAKSNTGRYLDQQGSNIKMSTRFPEAGGYVSDKNKNEINLNPNNPTPTGLGEIFVHEFQHVLDKERPDAISKLLENKAPTGATYRDTSENFNKLFENVNKTYNKYKSKYKLSNDFVSSGLIAELRRIESTLPAGKNIFDTDIGKEIAKDLPYFKVGYYNQTRPRTGTHMYSLDTGLGE